MYVNRVLFFFSFPPPLPPPPSLSKILAFQATLKFKYKLSSCLCFVCFQFKILTWLRGFRGKIANFSRLHCLAIPRRELSTKKTKPNIEKWPESLLEKLKTMPTQNVRVTNKEYYGMLWYFLYGQLIDNRSLCRTIQGWSDLSSE